MFINLGSNMGSSPCVIIKKNKFLIGLCCIIILCTIVKAENESCEKQGERLSVPGTWEPPEGTDPQWLTRNITSDEFTILGAGSVSAGNQVDRWSYSFSIQNYDISERMIYYESGASYFNDLGYTSKNLLPNGTRLEDFMINEVFPNATERALFPNVVYFPLMVQPIVFTYNYSKLNTFTVNKANQSVYLTVELLADIYLGYVTNWNDSRIRALNPWLASLPVQPGLVNQTIVPIGYSGFVESSTYYVTESMWYHSERFRKAFPDGPIRNWPLNDTRLNPRLLLVGSAVSTFAFVRNTPGGIGYMNYQIYKNACAGARAPYVLFRDKKLRPLLPDEPTTMRMYQDIRMNHRFELDQVDYNISSGWPFTTVSYLHFNFKENVSLPECTPKGDSVISKDRLMLLFFRWIYTNDISRRQGSYNGVYSLPEHIIKRVVDELDELTCGDDEIPIAVIEVKDDHDAGYFDALLALSMVMTGIVIPLCIFLTFLPDERRKVISKITIGYSIVLILGALLVYLSIIFFYLIPDDKSICQTRIWLFCLGASIFLGAIFTRTLQIHRIYRMNNSKKPLSNATSAHKAIIGAIIDSLLGIGISLTVQIVILIVQISVDPLDSVLSTIDKVERTASWVCKSSDTWIWVGLEIGYLVFMLIYGLWVVYRTWDLKAKFGEARWLLMSIYNMLFTITVIVAIGATIEVKDDTIFIMAVSAILFIITTTLFLIYIPKFGGNLQSLIFKWRSRTSIEGDTTRSKSRNTGASISSSSMEV